MIRLNLKLALIPNVLNNNFLSTITKERYVPRPDLRAILPRATKNGIHTAAITESVGGIKNVEHVKRVSRDFRSDTLTIPTDAQLLAGLSASRGDDVYREDDDTAKLEARVAKLTGKESGLFLVSGTMSNQLAIRSHLTQPPHSVLLDHRAHIHMWEAGGIALFSQATTHALVPRNQKYLTLAKDILPNLSLGSDIHTAPTRLISLENTLSGTIFPQDEIVKISEEAVKHGIIMHLDGARIWEVAASRLGEESGDEKLGPVLSELCAPFKSVSLCLSKGIGAPVGSVLVGPKEFIDRARWFRKMFGGGIRQSGALAAAASMALTQHFPKLYKTHVLADRLSEGIQSLGGSLLVPTETNMVWFDLDSLSIPDQVFMEAAKKKGITVMGERLVVHHQIEPEAVDDLLEIIKVLKEEFGDVAVSGKEKRSGAGY